jgi:hypothetical protein
MPSGLYKIMDGSKEKMGPRRMKAAIEAMSSKKVGQLQSVQGFIICLPPHIIHKMQPMDNASMVPPKTLYCQKIEK